MPFISAVFTRNGIPQTGLSPTIDIYRVDSATLVVNDGAMDEIGGFYRYEFTSVQGFVVGVDYVFQAMEPTLGNPNRYFFGTSRFQPEEVTTAVLDVQSADHQIPGSVGEAIAAGAAAADDFTVNQGWTYSISNPVGTRLRGTIALERNGEFVAVPGSASLLIQAYNADGTLNFSQVIGAPNVQGFFEVEEDPFTPAAGTVLNIVAAISGSGVGSGMHVSLEHLPLADFG